MNPHEYVMGNTTFYSTDQPKDDATTTAPKTPAATTTPAAPKTPTASPTTTATNAGQTANRPATQPSALSKDWAFLDDPNLKNLPNAEAYRNFALGKGFTGTMETDPRLKNISLFGMSPKELQGRVSQGMAKSITPQSAKKALTDQYNKNQQDALYKQYFRTDSHGNSIAQNPKIKYGTKGPADVEFGHLEFKNMQQVKNVAKTAGAGAYAVGIDPRDPNAEQLAAAWIRNHEGQSKGPGTAWSKILGDGTWGRFDAKVPGLAALKKQFPKASNLALLDAVVRMSYSQAGLEPVDDTMKILGPIMVAAGAFLGPLAATAMGSTMAGSTAAALGAGAMGTLSSGIQSDWDLGQTLLGGGTAALSAGMGYNPAATMAQNLTKAGVQTAIGATGFIDPNLPTALNFATAAYGGAKTGNWNPLLKKGASYAFQSYVPGPYGKLGAMAIEQSGKRKS